MKDLTDREPLDAIATTGPMLSFAVGIGCAGRGQRENCDQTTTEREESLPDG